jgi:hypothetical protein
MSMIEKLPAWMKWARNRKDIAAAVARLEVRLHNPGRSTPHLGRPAKSADLRRCGAHEHRYDWAASPPPAARAQPPAAW